MRIIAGQYKGRAITAPKGSDITRPALAKVREAIFSSIGGIEDYVIMDVFAGTGSLGFEALSRGAARVYFIENHPAILKCIITTAEQFKCTDQVRIIKRRMPDGLKTLRIAEPIDVLFCDPPYDKNLVNSTLAALLELGFITDETLTIVEHSPRESIDVKGLKTTKLKEYGQTRISYLKLNGDES